MTYWWGQDIKIPIPKLDLTKAYSEPVKHIVVLGEQGLGDEICYASVLPELIARAGHKAIEFQCYPRLKEIFERSFKVRCTDRLPLSEVKVGEAVITLGDLLPLYRKSREHFPRKPFLRVDPQKVALWLEWLNPFPRPWVGYAYKSRHGSFTHDEFWKILGDGAKFDLQYDSDTRHKPPFDTKNDFENLFAFVSCLDRVESVTQTLCHVAGAIGKECHAVIPPKNGETISKLMVLLRRKRHMGVSRLPQYEEDIDLQKGWKATIGGKKYGHYIMLDDPVCSPSVVAAMRENYEHSRREMSQELAALEELKGRCQAIQIVWLDTGVRMQPAIEKFTKHINEAVKRPLLPQETQELAEEILDLRQYFLDVRKKCPEVRREFDPAIKVCNWLVEPINK
jgi:hypothetical protein